ncbi:hypothetical protein [Wocania ichthyoenteri]|uniref:hypothetical protein n=1 Tax=Wocania ichthyoenteri TaxID=1230531 RepID=UPI00053E2833|nr:hypothetical protein [Wocania ichthyoenteri]
MKKLIIVAAVFISTTINAQDNKQLSISIMNENIHYKAKGFNNFNPGGEIGMTLKKKDRKYFFSEFNIYAGGYYHKKVETAFYLRGDYSFGIKLQDVLAIDLHGGLGYMHTFYPGHLYEQNNNGDFEKINQTGRPHAIANAGLGITVLSSGRVKPFIKYELMGETPFANGIPFVPHSFLKLGIKYNFKK